MTDSVREDPPSKCGAAIIGMAHQVQYGMPDQATRRDPVDGRGAVSRRGQADLRAAFNDAMPEPGWAEKAGSAIVVACFKVRDWECWLPEAEALLDASELERMRRQRFVAGRMTLTLAYAQHRLLLSAAIGQHPRDVPLYRDARGCPRLHDDSAYTSLSHADGVVAMAVSTLGPVGVDIEPVARAAGLVEIAERVCHPAEASALVGKTTPAYRSELIALWVRKEALLKEAGIGLALEMDGFPAPCGRLRSPVDGHWLDVAMVDVGPTFRAAVAGPLGVLVASSWLKLRR